MYLLYDEVCGMMGSFMLHFKSKARGEEVNQIEIECQKNAKRMSTSNGAAFKERLTFEEHPHSRLNANYGRDVTSSKTHATSLGTMGDHKLMVI